MHYLTTVLANQDPGGRRGLIKINKRPMIEYVLDAVPEDTDEIVIMAQQASLNEYRDIAENYGAQLLDAGPKELDIRFHLEQLFREKSCDAVVALSCDTPLINREVVMFLRDVVTRFSAGIPRPVFDKPEFTPASYRVKPFLQAMDQNPELKMGDLVKHVGNVLYISLQSFKVFDDKLRFLVKVQTQSDVRKAAQILQSVTGE
ncbi:MAG: NTP transferase domain-containing protein [Candidatus Caldarchaeum sp.]|uniref:MobA-like NTP transferase domain-containing protein n=1 Tax=Caldiarchaeum subterraneum TaxID=311458 RepID=A0A7C4E2A4_CALS0